MLDLIGIVKRDIVVDNIMIEIWEDSSLYAFVPEDSELSDFYDYKINVFNKDESFITIYEGSWVIGNVGIEDVNNIDATELEGQIYDMINDYVNEQE